MSKQHYKNKQHSDGSNNSTISLGSQSHYEDAPSNQEIEALAYRIHEEKGGSDLDNWLEAERVLKERHS